MWERAGPGTCHNTRGLYLRHQTAADAYTALCLKFQVQLDRLIGDSAVVLQGSEVEACQGAC